MIKPQALLTVFVLSLGLGAQTTPPMSLAVQTGNAQLDAALYKAAWARLSRQYQMTEHGSRSETGLVEIAACGDSEEAPPSPLEGKGDITGWFTRWEFLPKASSPKSRKSLPEVFGHPIHLLMRTTMPGGNETVVHRAVVNMTSSGQALRDNPQMVDTFAQGWVESLLYSVRLNQK